MLIKTHTFFYFFRLFLKHKKRLTFILCLNIFSLASRGQSKQILILNSDTKNPLGGVSVYFNGKQEGLVTNDDGVFRINFKEHQLDTLSVSYIGFKNRKIKVSDLSKKDTIMLMTSNILLQEVNFYSLNLKAKFNKFYKNYWSYYSSDAKLYDCTYKEVLKVNDSIARLNQVQMKWSNQKYRLPFGKTLKKDLEKENQFSIINIDYAKINDNKSLFSSTGHLENDDFIKYMFSNFYSLIIDECSDIKIESITNYSDSKKVVFSSPITENGKIVMTLDSGVIFFENGTDAIQDMKLNFIYHDNNNNNKDLEKSQNIAYSTSINSMTVDISFKKTNGKWFLNNYDVNTYSTAFYKNRADKLNIIQKLIITKIEKDKKIPKDERININMSFFKNLPLYKNQDQKIILTKEEQEFMKEGEDNRDN